MKSVSIPWLAHVRRECTERSISTSTGTGTGIGTTTGTGTGTLLLPLLLPVISAWGGRSGVRA